MTVVPGGKREPERPPRLAGNDRLLALVLVAVAILGVRTAYKAGFQRDPAKPTRTDIFCYVVAADALVAGESPFGKKDEHGLPYVYPPAVALLFLPLRVLGRPLIPIAWFAISVSVLAWGALALRRALGSPRGKPWLELGVPLALVAIPAASGLERGQVGPVLAGLVALGCADLVTKRETRGGFAIGATVAMKVTPLLALGTLALDRRPKALAGAALALVLLLGVGPAFFLGPRGALAANEDFVRGMGVRYAEDPASEGFSPEGRDYAVQDKPDNQSLTAILHRTRVGPTGAYVPLSRVLTIAVVVLALVPALRLRRGAAPERTVAALGLAAAASLLVAPVAWHHHHVLLLPALMAVATDAARRERRGVFLALGVFLVLELLHFAVPALRPFGLLGLGTLIPLALAFHLAWNNAPPQSVG
jgi:hypothetical protein